MSDSLRTFVPAGMPLERAKDRPRLRLNRASVRGAEAGLLALFFDLFAFALFGPAFNYWLGLLLFSLAVGFGGTGILLAHRAAHALRRDPYAIGRPYVTVGRVTAWLAFLLGAGYIGLLYLVFSPIVLIVVFTAGALAFAFHLEKRHGEEHFLRTLDLGAGVAACGRCHGYVPLATGRWRSSGWLCPRCDANPWGVSG